MIEVLSMPLILPAYAILGRGQFRSPYHHEPFPASLVEPHKLYSVTIHLPCENEQWRAYLYLEKLTRYQVIIRYRVAISFDRGETLSHY